MGAYVYRVTAPKNNRTIMLNGEQVVAAVAIYAFKPSWSDDKFNQKYWNLISCWTRGWEDVERPKYVVVAHVPHGEKLTAKTSLKEATVLEWTKGTSFYDDPDWEGQPFVGHLDPKGTHVIPAAWLKQCEVLTGMIRMREEGDTSSPEFLRLSEMLDESGRAFFYGTPPQEDVPDAYRERLRLEVVKSGKRRGEGYCLILRVPPT